MSDKPNEIRVTRPSWLTVAGTVDSDLTDELTARVEKRIADKKFTREDLKYINSLPASIVKGELRINDQQLEKLRRLCQLAEVQLVPAKISSHRQFVGPIIVTGKRILFSILGVLLKETLRRQRDFNAAVISYLTTETDLAVSSSKEKDPKTAAINSSTP